MKSSVSIWRSLRKCQTDSEDSVIFVAYLENINFNSKDYRINLSSFLWSTKTQSLECCWNRKSFFENHVKLHLSISQLFWANLLSKKVASFCVYSCHHECESGETADAKDNNAFFKRILRRIDVIPLCNNSSEVCGRSLSSTPQFSACWVRAGEEKK